MNEPKSKREIQKENGNEHSISVDDILNEEEQHARVRAFVVRQRAEPKRIRHARRVDRIYLNAACALVRLDRCLLGGRMHIGGKCRARSGSIRLQNMHMQISSTSRERQTRAREDSPDTARSPFDQTRAIFFSSVARACLLLLPRWCSSARANVPVIDVNRQQRLTARRSNERTNSILASDRNSATSRESERGEKKDQWQMQDSFGRRKPNDWMAMMNEMALGCLFT